MTVVRGHNGGQSQATIDREPCGAWKAALGEILVPGLMLVVGRVGCADSRAPGAGEARGSCGLGRSRLS
jgi:hypothetical protein